jgi:PAS domain S-box-containing protein
VPIIAWEADPITWRFTFVSEQAEAITGYPSDEWLRPGFWPDHIHPDDRESAVSFCMRSTNAGDAHDFEYRFMKADGGVMWIRDMVSVVMRDGRPALLYGVMIDVTDRRNAEEALRLSNAHHESVIEALAEGVMMLDHDGIITTCNGAAERILGFPAAQMIGTKPSDSQWRTFHEDGTVFPAEHHPVAVTRRTGEPQSGVIMGVYRPNGDLAWISINTRRATPPDHAPPHVVVASFSDVTQRKEAEQRQRLLTRELDHRVKNNLASVLSIAEQTAAAARSLPEFRTAFTARIAAMARAHEALAAARWDAVDFADAARLVLGPFAQEQPQRVRLHGRALRVEAPIAIPLALALHEMLTNAVKYGALSNREGSVTLAWEDVAGELRLVWSESGGPVNTAASEPGVGSRLIEGLIRYQLRGSVSIQHLRNGTRCEITIPLTNHAARDKA